MGTILVASLQGGKWHGSLGSQSDSNGRTCRSFAALFLCTFGITVCFCTKPEAFWLRAGILALTGTSAFILLAPLHKITSIFRRIHIAFKFIYGPSEKTAVPVPVTSCIKKAKHSLTIATPTTIESKQFKIEYPLHSPLGSPHRSSLPSYENISVVS